MGEHETARRYGRVVPSEVVDVVAGSHGTWKLTFITGALGVDENASVKVVWRFASDWGRPQFDHPQAADFASVETTADARLEAGYQPKGWVRPWGRCLHIDVRDGSLAPGDTLTVTLGDASRGSPGSRAQTFRQQGFEFRVLVDCHGTWQFVRVPGCLRLNIVPGPAERLIVVAPSRLAVGETGRVTLKVEDQWRNPATGYTGEATVAIPRGEQRTLAFGPEDEGLISTEMVFPKTGCLRLSATAGGGELTAESNPAFVGSTPPELRPFWGDLHGQSAPTIGTGTIAEYFDFARTHGALDFTSHQGNDFQITRRQWEETQRNVARVTEDGRFVAFVGYEWSGTPGAGGDRNVLYLHGDETLHRSSHMQVSDTSDVDTDRHPVERLFEELRERDALMIAHVGGRPADMSRHDDRVERLVEIHSAWGTFEWLLFDALERGHHVGIVANSDDHSGRPGANHPGRGHFGTEGGLTCVLAPELTKQAVWDALRARRCYGTSGPRILLDFSANGHPMGAACRSSEPPRISARVYGTAGIERIDVLRGTQVVHTHRPLDPARASGCRLRVSWTGSRVRGRARAAHWDGGLTVRGNRITSVAPYAFDTPAEGITSHDESTVRWHSKTSGDPDGVILQVEQPYRGTLAFDTAIARFELDLAELAEGPYVIEAGGLGLQVAVEVLPDGPAPRAAALKWTDPAAPPGEHAYWLRVVQEDGHRAWPSPVFVTV